MRCPDCQKFVSFEEVEPEFEEDLGIGEDGVVRCIVRLVNACQECSAELTEAHFDLEAEIEIKGHEDDGHELSVEETGVDRGSKQGFYQKGKFFPKYGRYGKTFYTVSVSFKVTCSCGKFEVEESIEDEIQASGMDQLT